MEFVVRAPGRVNLIGEHTDYNDGFVLPAAIDLEVRLVARPTDDRLVQITTASTGELAGFLLDGVGQRQGSWIDYVAGVAWSLQQAGFSVGGFEGRLEGNLPQQAGLSSSAAVELAAALALLESAGAIQVLDALELAQLCKRAENEYVGVNSGLMDQFAVACGEAGHALLLDCRSLEWRPVAIPAELSLVIVETGARRRLIGSEYNERRAQCEAGVSILAARGEPVTALRDATVAMLDAAAEELGDVVYRRCRHVVEENGRALAAVAALESGDLPALGELFAASHASLRDLYEVSSVALDAAVEIAAATPGVVASRITGAGFGGCTVNLVERGAESRLRDAIENDYTPLTGLVGTVHEVHAADGAGIVGA